MKKGISLFFGFILVASLAQPALAASVIFAGASQNFTYCGANIWSVSGYHTVSVVILDPIDANGSLLLDAAIKKCTGFGMVTAGGQKSGITGQDYFLSTTTNDNSVLCEHQRRGWTRGRILVEGVLRVSDEQDGGCESGECLGA